MVWIGQSSGRNANGSRRCWWGWPCWVENQCWGQWAALSSIRDYTVKKIVDLTEMRREMYLKYLCASRHARDLCGHANTLSMLGVHAEGLRGWRKFTDTFIRSIDCIDGWCEHASIDDTKTEHGNALSQLTLQVRACWRSRWRADDARPPTEVSDTIRTWPNKNLKTWNLPEHAGGARGHVDKLSRSKREISGDVDGGWGGGVNPTWVRLAAETQRTHQARRLRGIATAYLWHLGI